MLLMILPQKDTITIGWRIPNTNPFFFKNSYAPTRPDINQIKLTKYETYRQKLHTGGGALMIACHCNMDT